MPSEGLLSIHHRLQIHCVVNVNICRKESDDKTILLQVHANTYITRIKKLCKFFAKERKKKKKTFGIDGSFGATEKKFSIINFSKATTKFCLSLHSNADNSNLFVNRKEIFTFKAENKSVNFLAQFCRGSISNGFSANESREVS